MFNSTDPCTFIKRDEPVSTLMLLIEAQNVGSANRGYKFLDLRSGIPLGFKLLFWSWGFKPEFVWGSYMYVFQQWKVGNRNVSIAFHISSKKILSLVLCLFVHTVYCYRSTSVLLVSISLLILLAYKWLRNPYTSVTHLNVIRKCRIDLPRRHASEKETRTPRLRNGIVNYLAAMLKS